MKANDIVSNYNFRVFFGLKEVGFSRISGIGGAAEYDTFVEGGGRMHLLPKPRSSSGTITFEKGMTFLDKSTLNLFMPGNDVSGMIIMVMKNSLPAETYMIEQGVVTSWELGDLDGMSAGAALRKFSVVYSGVTVI